MRRQRTSTFISEKHIVLKRIEYIDLGRMDYGQCWDLQRSVFDAMLAAKRRGNREVAACGEGAAICGDKAQRERGEGAAACSGAFAVESCGEDTTACGDKAGTLFLVEHPPVYTLGKNGRIGNLLVGEERLHACGAEFYRTDRGGDITFHGEGQIVGYPILDLERIGIGLREYIAALEQSVIDTVAEYGIRAGRLAGASGVWLGDGAEFGNETAERAADNGTLRKICAIGVRASRFITMHGFALNVSTDLRRFDVINPCGFTDKGATSMARELGCAPDMEEVKRKLAEHLSENLNVKIYKN